MRLLDFRTLTEQQLDELKMSPGSLKNFAYSPAAEGMRAGFEAELIFRDIREDSYDSDDPYPNDDRCGSIDNIIDFFTNDEDGNGISRSEARQLREKLEEKFFEWREDAFDSEWDSIEFDSVRDFIEENTWDWDEEISKALDDMGLSDDEIEAAEEAGRKAPRYNSSREERAARDENINYANWARAQDVADSGLDSAARSAIRAQDSDWDGARDEARDEYFDRERLDEDDWLREEGWRDMSDISQEFWLDWPYVNTSDGGFDREAIGEVAKNFKRNFGVPVVVSPDYANAVRNDVNWIFEEDGSIEPESREDVGVEVVSPPMSLVDCLEMLPKFFEWASDRGAYTNSSTGYHIGVSLPHGSGRGNVDFMKLALFLGDEYVLEEFKRSSNQYCKSAMNKIKTRMSDLKGSPRVSDRITDALDLMRHGLIELARRSLLDDNGFGKYFSINPKENYIEFRSAGNENYHLDVPKLQNTMMRYAQAMYVAGDPALERRGYYKKLYKLIAPETGSVEMDLFSRYASGAITGDELKDLWSEHVVDTAAGARNSADNPAAVPRTSRERFAQNLSHVKLNWDVYKIGYNDPSLQLWDKSRREAEAYLNQTVGPNWREQFHITSHGERGPEELDAATTATSPSASAATADTRPMRWTGGWKVVDQQGNTLYQIHGIGNNILDAERHAERWKQENGYHLPIKVLAEFEPVDAIAESLQAREYKPLLDKFIPFVKKRTGLEDLPKVKILDQTLDGTFGTFEDGEIQVVAKDRHPFDVLRTLAHELVHRKQDVAGELVPGAGETGTPEENEANALAGIIMRDFAAAYPELMKQLT